MRTMLWLCHAAIVGMARQVVAVLTIMLLFRFFETFSASSTDEFLASRNALQSWHLAFPYLSASFILLAYGIALTSGRSVNLAAGRIALAVGKIRMKRSKQLLMGLSVQFGLGSIVTAVLALRTPCEITSTIRCFSNPIYDVVWAGVLSVVVAGCGANAHASVKASTIIAP